MKGYISLHRFFFFFFEYAPAFDIFVWRNFPNFLSISTLNRTVFFYARTVRNVQLKPRNLNLRNNARPVLETCLVASILQWCGSLLRFSSSNSDNSDEGDPRLQIAFARCRYLSILHVYCHRNCEHLSVRLSRITVVLRRTRLGVQARRKARERRRIAARHNRMKSNRTEASRVQDISLYVLCLMT